MMQILRIQLLLGKMYQQCWSNMKPILQYEEKLWIKQQAFNNLENIKYSFFLNIRGRLYLSSFELGHHVLDMKNLTFLSFPAWIDSYTLLNSRSLSIINLTKDNSSVHLKSNIAILVSI